MKALSLMLCALTLVAGAAMAADAPAAPASCEDQAVAKKLAGAAKNSFMKKCDREAKAASAQAMCTSKSEEKKLAGAAKNSFMKKCVTDNSK